MKLLLSVLAAALVVSQSWGRTDTIRVEKALSWAPARAFRTYQTDSINLKGQKFNADDMLGKNVLMQGQPTGSIIYGQSLPTEQGTLSQFEFSLRATRYAKATIKVEGIHQYKLYDVFDHEISSPITLTANEQKVRLVCLAGKECKDTFKVSVICDSLYTGCITVNNPSPRPYSWDDMNLGAQYGKPRLSPSGRYLLQAYYSTKPDGQWDQWSVLTDLNTNRTLRRFEGAARYDWYQGEDILYYTRQRGKRTELVSLNPSTQAETILTNDLPDSYFNMAPNKEYLIYSVSEDGRGTQGALKYIEQPDDRQPGWRNRSSLWRMDLRTGLRQRLTFGSVSTYLADISADSRHLLLVNYRFDATRRPFSRTTLLQMDAYTGEVDTLLLDAEFLSGEFQYLPDGHRIIMTGTCNAFDNIGSELAPGRIGNAYQHCVFIYDLDTQKAFYPMPSGFKADITDIQIATADNAAYLHGEDGYDMSLYRLDLKTLALRKINIPISYANRISIALNQKRPRIIACGQNRGTEARRCVLGTSEGRFVPYGEIKPEEVNKGIHISDCIEWQFQSSRGDSIRCFYYDNGERPSQGKPMIVYYYGGCSPTSRVVEFLYPFQVWAGQGYTVLVVEPSGASGFGQEFGSRHVGTWGEGSAQDIIEATQQFCKEHSYIDASKVGCIGASYGGFMTQYLQTQTDIFAAAISHAGISNIASYWGGGYWGYSYGEVAEYGQFPWSDRELFVEHSPLFNADKIHTPLLLLHGTVDTNVPTTESQQLYTALKILGREVAYVTIDGENHAVADLTKRGDWARTIQAWFARWLKGQPEWWDDLYPASKK